MQMGYSRYSGEREEGEKEVNDLGPCHHYGSLVSSFY